MYPPFSNELYRADGHLPNVTVLTPGGCNARCDFCFWDSEGNQTPPPDYKSMLDRALGELFANGHRALSISGGEPGVSRHLEKVLRVVSHYSWDRVVLTTNGSNLYRTMQLAQAHRLNLKVNISRHHFEDVENAKIFKTGVLPTTANLGETIRRHGRGPFSINCVVPHNYSVEFAKNMIEYTKSLGLSRLALRTEAGDVSPSPTELALTAWPMAVLSRNNCPVCRTTVVEIDGVTVMFKGSHPEPSQFLGCVYEYIVHPDARVYADWRRKLPVTIHGAYGGAAIRAPQVIQRPPVGCGVQTSGGCGSGSHGGCGSGGCGR